MSNADKPGWPAAAAFPFMSFTMPGVPTQSASPAAATAPASALAGGVDLLKSFWGSLPGSSQVPGFLVPTIDVDELDRRIVDLRAAESWVEVNLNLLRATIQGLEVQRHTIAALKSMSTTPAPTAGAFDWTSLTAAPPPAPAAVAPAPVPPAEPKIPPPPAPSASAPLPELAATTWLGYLQDQFAKVAEAALSGATTGTPARSDRDPSAREGASGKRASASRTAKPGASGASKRHGKVTARSRKPPIVAG